MRTLFVVYDNESRIHFFPLGIAYVTAALLKEGFDVEIYNQDIHHYSEEDLTEHLNKNKYDIVGVGLQGGYFQYIQLLKISRAVKASKNRPIYYIIGGAAPSPEPEYFLNKTEADIAVIGEGEETIVELFHAISDNKPLNNINGIAYRSGDKVTITPDRPLIQDIDSILWPAYDLFLIEYYRLIEYPNTSRTDFVMPVLSARGCTFKCNFCYRMDKGYRARRPEAIIEEIKFLQKQYRISYIDFADELLMSSKKRVVELCEAFIKAKLRFKWCCNGRLNYATPEIVRLMKDTGCVYINYGIEAFDDGALLRMNKGLNTEQITKGIKATLDAGISPGFNIIFGNIGENKETLRKGVEFLLQYDDGAELRTIRPVTPYPGSPLYYYAIEKGLLRDCEDFYENKHLNSDLLAVNFTDIGDDEFYESLMDANITLIENYFKNKLGLMIDNTRSLYMNRDPSFRGFRTV